MIITHSSWSSLLTHKVLIEKLLMYGRADRWTQESLKCFVPTANNLIITKLSLSLCLKRRLLFHSDYCIWSSWSALETKVFFPVLIHCVRDSVSCQLQSSARHCPVRKVCPDYCQRPLGWLLMLHLQIHIAYTQAPFLLSLLCDFDYPQSTGIVTAVGFLLV